MKSSGTTCYMCESKSFSKEHVPPRCLFPKPKDLKSDQNMRKNLLTVPSCDIHNSEKSGEDAYFLNVLTGSNLINETGREHYRNQIRRQNLRNKSIISRFAQRAIEVDGKLGHVVEIDRLDNFVFHLGLALYYAHFSKKWSGGIEWVPEFMPRFPDEQAEEDRILIVQSNDIDFHDVPFIGENPEVFKYQLIQNSKYIKMRLHFYEGCKIFLLYVEND